MSFEWQVEEDDQWEEEPTATGLVAGQQRWLKGARRALWTSLLLAMAAAAVFWQVSQRAATGLASVEAEIRATHQLVQFLAAKGDEEPFHALLSGRDLQWTGKQLDLFRQGMLFDRPAFGLQTSFEIDQLEANPEAAVITLSPDLMTAEVVSTRAYQPAKRDGQMGDVVLQHTAIYRRGKDRWLLSPPVTGFWGEWKHWTGEFLDLAFPERDEAIATRLALDIDRKLKEMCGRLKGINCPPGLYVRLRFDKDIDSLLQSADMENVLRNGTILELPTPSLVGLPVDDVAYRAIFNGYARQITAAAIGRLVKYECCRQGLFFRALLEKQQSRIGLAAWPLTQAEYSLIPRLPFRWTTLYADWNSAALAYTANWRQVYALVDFMVEEVAPAASIAEMQRQLSQPHGRYLTWVDNFMENSLEVHSFMKAWLQFIYQRTRSGQMALSPIPLPDQQVQLMCDNSPGSGMTTFRYDLVANRRLQDIGRGERFGLISPLSNGDYIIQDRASGARQNTPQTILFRDNQKITLLNTGENRFRLYLVGEDPTGRYGLLAAFGAYREQDRYKLLDLDTCSADNCPVSSLLARPYWSPDGLRTVIAGNSVSRPAGIDHDPPQNVIYLGDSVGQSLTTLAVGTLPFWLDNDTIGYVQAVAGDQEREPGAPQILLFRTISGNQAHVALDTSDLLAPIPAAQRPEKLFILSITPYPSPQSSIIIVASETPERSSGSSYVFLVEMDPALMEPQRVDMIFQSEKQAIADISPDGTWLSLFTDEGAGNVIHLFNMEGNDVMTVSSNGRWPAWSADGQWLLQRYDSYLTLIAPAYDYQMLLFADFSDCRTARWIGES